MLQIDQHNLQQKRSCEQHNKGGKILLGGVPFAIDVKGGEKEKEYDERGSMIFSINGKGGYY